LICIMMRASLWIWTKSRVNPHEENWREIHANSNDEHRTDFIVGRDRFNATGC